MNEIQFCILEAHEIMTRQMALTKIQATHWLSVKTEVFDQNSMMSHFWKYSLQIDLCMHKRTQRPEVFLAVLFVMVRLK